MIEKVLHYMTDGNEEEPGSDNKQEPREVRRLEIQAGLCHRDSPG